MSTCRTLTAILLLALTGCHSTRLEEQIPQSTIGFEVSCHAVWAEMKSAPVTTEDFHESFGVYAYLYSDSWTDDLLPDYIYNEEIPASGHWRTEHNWPGSQWKIRFFAYAPYDGKGIVMSGQNVSGAPTITYTVPDNALEQSDIVTASPDGFDGNHNSTVSLEFNHVLTAVSFVTGSDIRAGSISEVILRNVYGKAEHQIGTDSWNGHDIIRDFSEKVEADVSENTSGIPITEEAETFMMIPQTLPDNAEIEVRYTDQLTQTERTLTSSIGGTRWRTGEKIRYLISTGSITIEPVLEITTPSITYAGGDITLDIKSHYSVTDKDGTNEYELKWSTRFVEDDGNGNYIPAEVPDWIDVVDDGSGSGEYVLSIKKQTGIASRPNDDILQGNAAVGGIYDLSTDGGARAANTANCYLVNAPGTYCFPLVYGNAIKNGTANSSSYTYSGESSSSNFIKTLCNHLGNGITDPYIYKNDGCVPDHASLIWQDAPNLVTNVRLDHDKKNMVFDVNAESIRQGNAVLALYDANNVVLWSWHIWVTDYVLGNDLQHLVNTASETYSLMPVNIGWCDEYTTSYPSRTAYIEFTQEETGIVNIVKISHPASTVLTRGHAPLYQWGRKDPFLPWSGVKSNKVWYDSNGNESTDNFAYSRLGGFPTCVYRWIQNPNIYENNGRAYDNSWNNALEYGAGGNSEAAPAIKTVYDPSPKGFRVPRVIELDALSDAMSHSKFNSSTKAWDYDLTDLGGDKLSFKTVMLRNNTTGSLEDWSWRSYYMTGKAEGTSQYVLLLSTSDSTVGRVVSNLYAGTIRPVKE